MKITILGCGSSHGVPRIGCECPVCVSGESSNKRTRSSILIEKDDTTILVDAGPDFRQQALRHNIKKIDAVIYTHAHADHIFGTSDLRSLTFPSTKPIDIYATEASFETINAGFSYAFVEYDKIFKPFLKKNIIKETCKLNINGVKLQIFAQNHHKITTLGIHIGGFVYSTDVESFPEKSLKYLKNMDVWVLSCLRYYESPGHLSYEQALDLIEKYKPKKAYFTHMCHEISYEDLSRITPENISPAFDGLTIICVPNSNKYIFCHTYDVEPFKHRLLGYR